MILSVMLKEDNDIAFKALSEETERSYRLVANVIGRRFPAAPKTHERHSPAVSHGTLRSSDIDRRIDGIQPSDGGDGWDANPGLKFTYFVC